MNTLYIEYVIALHVDQNEVPFDDRTNRKHQ